MACSQRREAVHGKQISESVEHLCVFAPATSTCPEISLKLNLPSPSSLFMIHLFYVPQIVPAESALVSSLSSCTTFILPPCLTGFIFVPRVPSPILSPLAFLQGQAFMLTQLDDCNSSILFLTMPPTSTTWTTAAIIFSLFKIFPRVPRSYANSLAWHFSMPTPNSLLWHSSDLKLLFLSHSLPFPSHFHLFQTLSFFMVHY